VIDREYWEFHPEWRDYVLSKWEGRGRVEQVKDDSIAPFRERAKRAFLERNFPLRQIKTWINVMVPKGGDGYDEGYPHVHYPLTGLTLVHYLDTGDKPAPLHILESESGPVSEIIYPENGLTVFMPNDLWHGVLINNGTTKRVAMIATALR